MPIKNKKKRYYFRILQFISLTIIYYGGPQVHTECKSLTPNSNYSHRIQITHTEFKSLTPNSNHSHRNQITHTKLRIDIFSQFFPRGFLSCHAQRTTASSYGLARFPSSPLSRGWGALPCMGYIGTCRGIGYGF